MNPGDGVCLVSTRRRGSAVIRSPRHPRVGRCGGAELFPPLHGIVGCEAEVPSVFRWWWRKPFLAFRHRTIPAWSQRRHRHRSSVGDAERASGPRGSQLSLSTRGAAGRRAQSCPSRRRLPTSWSTHRRKQPGRALEGTLPRGTHRRPSVPIRMDYRIIMLRSSRASASNASDRSSSRSASLSLSDGAFRRRSNTS